MIPDEEVYKDIKNVLLTIPTHYGLIWFLSRDTLNEIVRSVKSDTLTIDFHFTGIRQDYAVTYFYEIASLMDYNLGNGYEIVQNRREYSLDIIYNGEIVVNIKLLILTHRRRLQYPDIGSWISILPHWLTPVDRITWKGIPWYIPNTRGEFVKSIYRGS